MAHRTQIGIKMLYHYYHKANNELFRPTKIDCLISKKIFFSESVA